MQAKRHTCEETTFVKQEGVAWHCLQPHLQLVADGHLLVIEYRMAEAFTCRHVSISARKQRLQILKCMAYAISCL
jgi:hypothetical protein